MDGEHALPGRPAAAPEEMLIHLGFKLLTQKESHGVATPLQNGSRAMHRCVVRGLHHKKA